MCIHVNIYMKGVFINIFKDKAHILNGNVSMSGVSGTKAEIAFSFLLFMGMQAITA